MHFHLLIRLRPGSACAKIRNVIGPNARPARVIMADLT
jgi:hypothetical protein